MLSKLTVAVSLAGAQAASSWVYANLGAGQADAAAQEATWGGLCSSGREQSPIDVVTSDTVAAPLPPITTHIEVSPTYVKNTGHGFQLFETSPQLHNLTDAGEVDSIAGSAKGYSMIGQDKFNFYQVHWHSPSENTVNGKSYPLEAHFVHQYEDPALQGTLHRLAVIGLLYELGECNEALDHFWDAFPIDSAGVSEYNGQDVDLNAKLNEELTHGYYHWYGSLTTPPCTESVSWNLLKKTETVCERQVERLQQALAATQNGIAFNNRVVQPLNHRVVVDTFGAAPSPPPPPTPPPATMWYYATEGSDEADAQVQFDSWGAVAPLCKTGKEQSPINVVTADAVDATLPTIQTHFDAVTEYVKNTGHGFQLFETSPNLHTLDTTTRSPDAIEGEAKGYSMIGNQQFNFYQVHWHTPSENTIDGKSFPLEAHFVHQFDDPALHGSYHRLAVIGLMYELGECNEFLDKFWADFPADKGISEYTGDAYDLNEKLMEELANGYYHWYGSLTTPPCTESVSWNLLKKTETVCERQVDQLKAALRTTQQGVSVNNRVVQPLNSRIVVQNGPMPTPRESDPSPPPPTPVNIVNKDDASTVEIVTLVFSVLCFATLLVVLAAMCSFLRNASRRSSSTKQAASMKTPSTEAAMSNA